jgi:hypothetical protein
MMMDAWAAKRLAELEAAGRARKKKREERFIRLPVLWWGKLTNPLAPGGTWATATHLHYLRYREHSETVKLANAALKQVGISRFTKWDALHDLERRGLIIIENRGKKSPMITLLKLGNG